MFEDIFKAIDSLSEGDINKARPVGSASGAIDKNKYVQKKVPVIRDGKTVLVTKYFDPAKGSGGNNGKPSGGKGNDNKTKDQKKEMEPPVYVQGDEVTFSDGSSGVVQKVVKIKTGYVVRVATEDGSIVDRKEKDLEKVTDPEKAKKITKDTIFATLQSICNTVSDDTPMEDKTLVLNKCLSAISSGIVKSMVIYGKNYVGKNSLTLNELKKIGKGDASKDNILDSNMLVVYKKSSDIKSSDDLKMLLEENPKNLIVINDSENNIISDDDLKSTYSDAIENLIINVDFNGGLVLILDCDESEIPLSFKNKSLTLDMNMSKENMKTNLKNIINDLDFSGLDEDSLTDDDDDLKSFLNLKKQNKVKKSFSDLPLDCILLSVDELTDNNQESFEQINVGGFELLYKK